MTAHITAPDAGLQLFKTCFDVSSEALLLLEIQSEEPFQSSFIAANEKACELFGIAREDLLSLGPRKLFGQFIDSKVIDVLARLLLQNGFHHYEMDLTHCSGKKFPAEVFSTLFETDGRKYTHMRIKNIETKKRTLAELEERKGFIDTVLQTIEALVIVMDPEGSILEWNRHCESVSGYTFAEVKGRAVWDVMLSEKERPLIKERFQGAAHLQIPGTYENVWVNKNGELANIQWSNTVISHPSGTPEYIIATGIEITGLKKAERSLQESSEKYRRLIETNPDGIALYKDEKISLLNAAAESVFEGSSLSLHQDKLLIHEIENSLADRKEIHHIPSLEIQQQDGTNRYIEARSISMGLSQSLILFRDHTDRILAERERDRLFRYLSDILSSTAEGIIGIDSANMAAYANKSFREWTGLSLEQLKNSPAPELIQKAFPLAGWDFDTLLSSEKPLELSSIKNGKIQHFEAKAQSFRDGHIITFYDITDRFSLSKANNIYYEAITSGIVVQNAKGIIVFANQKACEILGLEKDQIYGMTSKSPEWKAVKEDMTPLQPDEHPAMITLKDLKEISQFTMGIFHPLQQTYRWIVIDTRIVYKDEGTNVPYVISTFQDISDKITMDKVMRKREKTALIGQLATSVAHEIRNPLTVINGFLKMMEASGELNAAYMSMINKELERLGFVANEFLTLGKAENLEKTELDLVQDVLFPVTQLLLPSSNIAGIYLDITQLHKGIVVEGRKNQLKQLFINILKNSIEAMHYQGKIVLTIDQSENMAKVVIEDQGPGIPPDRLKHLGEPFYSLKEKGTGLGLAICRKIVLEHSGEMEITSEEGFGTAVTVFLPAVKKNP
ncbi:PAS domain S-box protein [Metabacillus sp. GX 13764]|uniref:PAS domain-containing sensor histidine kinase n=1 Tax=Metabacillus kandeliae TaxID=2900151 RepID=UPI001E46113B|nr:PAS domain-containing sensor histidine kinase [Metabacillus kandeliae]MCD7033982.1 PAS domain S-box protein [Metabacillus kandeliae]